MKLLIAVKSCKRAAENGCHDSIRRTWGKHAAPAELRFFLGRDPDGTAVSVKSHQDCTWVNAPDDYEHLPFKTREITRWFLQRNFDYLFLCDNDTFLIPERLLSCGFAGHDYAGRFRFGSERVLGRPFDYKDDGRGNRIPLCYPWALGGFGYFLSRKASAVVASESPTHWAEDLSVGQMLGPLIRSGAIRACAIPNFGGQVAWHFPPKAYGRMGYDPSFGWMEKMYRRTRSAQGRFLVRFPWLERVEGYMRSLLGGRAAGGRVLTGN